MGFRYTWALRNVDGFTLNSFRPIFNTALDSNFWQRCIGPNFVYLVGVSAKLCYITRESFDETSVWSEAIRANLF